MTTLTIIASIIVVLSLCFALCNRIVTYIKLKKFDQDKSKITIEKISGEKYEFTRKSNKNPAKLKETLEHLMH